MRARDAAVPGARRRPRDRCPAHHPGHAPGALRRPTRPWHAGDRRTTRAACATRAARPWAASCAPARGWASVHSLPGRDGAGSSQPLSRRDPRSSDQLPVGRAPGVRCDPPAVHHRVPGRSCAPGRVRAPKRWRGGRCDRVPRRDGGAGCGTGAAADRNPARGRAASVRNPARDRAAAGHEPARAGSEPSREPGCHRPEPNGARPAPGREATRDGAGTRRRREPHRAGTRRGTELPWAGTEPQRPGRGRAAPRRYRGGTGRRRPGRVRSAENTAEESCTGCH